MLIGGSGAISLDDADLLAFAGLLLLLLLRVGWPCADETALRHGALERIELAGTPRKNSASRHSLAFTSA